MKQPKEFTVVPRPSINYLFFGVYFAIIAFIHVLHIFLIEPHVSISSYFFVVYALSQCALETLVLVFVAGILSQYLPRAINLFALFVFFLFLTHIIDFPLTRLWGMSFWYALNWVSLLSYETFIELLLASNIPIFVWIVLGIVATAFMIMGVVLYRLSEKWTMRRSLIVSLPMVFTALSTLCLFLLSWDYGMHEHVAKGSYFDRYLKTLPWKNTLFPQKLEYITLKTSLQEPETDTELLRSLDSRAFSLARKPDIYLFVIESLREDYIDEVHAPHLHQFKEDNVSFKMALSNANATHLSWFSLFYSKFPFYWGKISPDEWKGGSIPLALLKKMGYKIRVNSSARLGYFEMDRVIFGEGGHLADSMFILEDDESEEVYIRDQKAMDNLLVEMNKPGTGRVFIVFLDATHLDYSWPKESTRFNPVDENIDYFKAVVSNNGMEKIKNRYRNALYFVDSLFAKFLEALPHAPGGADAVVVVTGDHGEEFYEQGNIFHASDLTHPQMHIPLYYRFGANKEIKKELNCPMTCHMDVFPTLFHYLCGQDLMGEVLQGESIFKEDRWPYTVVARFNASRSPTEFCIHNGTCKMIAQFTDERDIFNSKGLRILSTKNCQDENIQKEISAVHDEFDSALNRIFTKPSPVK